MHDIRDEFNFLKIKGYEISKHTESRHEQRQYLLLSFAPCSVISIDHGVYSRRIIYCWEECPLEYMTYIPRVYIYPYEGVIHAEFSAASQTLPHHADHKHRHLRNTQRAPAVSRQAWRTRLKALPANTLRHSAWPFGPRRLIVHRPVWCENMMMATTRMLVDRVFHCSGVSKMCNRSSFASQREASSSSSAIPLYWVSCINIGFEDKNSMKKNLTVPPYSL